MLILGTGILIDNQTRDIADNQQILGKIKRTQIQRKKSKVGAFPFRSTIEQDHLLIELESKELFWTFNPKQQYTSIQTQLLQGRKVKIYYYKNSDPSSTNIIYQIESDGHVIIDHKEFSKSHSIAALAIIGFGLLCLGLEIWLLITKTINKNWAQNAITNAGLRVR